MPQNKVTILFILIFKLLHVQIQFYVQIQIYYRIRETVSAKVYNLEVLRDRCLDTLKECVIRPARIR